MIPFLGKIKTFALAILGVASAVFFGLFQMERAGRQSDKRKIAEKSQEVTEKATQAIIEGEKAKEKARESDDSDGDYFTR